MRTWNIEPSLLSFFRIRKNADPLTKFRRNKRRRPTSLRDDSSTALPIELTDHDARLPRYLRTFFPLGHDAAERSTHVIQALLAPRGRSLSSGTQRCWKRSVQGLAQP